LRHSKRRAPPYSLLARGLHGRTHLRLGRRFDQAAAAATADLATLAPRVAGLVGGPLVSGPLLMGGASALAGDLALLLGGHGGEAPAFLAFIVHRPVLYYISH